MQTFEIVYSEVCGYGGSQMFSVPFSVCFILDCFLSSSFRLGICKFEFETHQFHHTYTVGRAVSLCFRT